MSKKKSLFGGGFGDGQPAPATPVQHIPQAAPIQYASPKQSFFSKLSGLASLGNMLIFAYIFLGEVLLPEHLKATTYLGKRLGGIQGQTAIYAAPEQAQAATIVESAKAEVEINKSCEIQVKQAAFGVYNNCMNQPGGAHPVCNLQTKLYLDMNRCDDVVVPEVQ